MICFRVGSFNNSYAYCHLHLDWCSIYFLGEVLKVILFSVDTECCSHWLAGENHISTTISTLNCLCCTGCQNLFEYNSNRYKALYHLDSGYLQDLIRSLKMNRKMYFRLHATVMYLGNSADFLKLEVYEKKMWLLWGTHSLKLIFG